MFRLPLRRKPVVHYNAVGHCEVGDSAELYCLDHPTQTAPVTVLRTSRVLSFDRRSGRIETRNTCYLPASNLKT